MTDTVERTESSVHMVTDEEAHASFDTKARKGTGMGGEEFLRRYDAGDFDDTPDDLDHPGYWSLVLAIPFGR